MYDRIIIASGCCEIQNWWYTPRANLLAWTSEILVATVKSGRKKAFILFLNQLFKIALEVKGLFFMKIKKSLLLIARVAIFGALAIILYMVPGLQFPIFPGLTFLKIHFDEIPVLFASLAYGPLTGSLIIFLKGIFKLIQDIGETGGIGVMADIIYGLAFILPAAFIYKYHKGFKMGLVAIFVGMLVNLIFSAFIGYYLIYPLYGFYFVFH